MSVIGTKNKQIMVLISILGERTSQYTTKLFLVQHWGPKFIFRSFLGKLLFFFLNFFFLLLFFLIQWSITDSEIGLSTTDIGQSAIKQ